MTQFSYKAVDKHGAAINGTIEAADRKSAVQVLADAGRFVTAVAETDTRSGSAEETSSLVLSVPTPSLVRQRVRMRDIVAMTHQFSTALRAGLPLMGCLELIRDQQKRPAMQTLLDDLVESVNAGQALSDALAKHPEVFNSLYQSMIRVGETGGILEQTTQQLGLILRREEKIKTSLKNAAAYPMFVLCLGIVSVAIIMTWILPGVMNTLDVEASALPGPTRLLMGVSHVVTLALTTVQGWVVVATLVAGVICGWRWIKGEGRVQWDGFRLKIPIFGTVLRTIAVGRFTRTLGALTEGGVTILEALKVVRDTLGNEVLALGVDTVAEEVRKGASLAKPLDKAELFPALLVQIVAVGEQTGKLDELLLNAADTFDEEADAAITRFMNIFPALLILCLAVVIGFIIIATLLPMVTMELGGV